MTRNFNEDLNLLLDRGADINARNNDGYTSFQLAELAGNA
jgi:ankyrin repeat protein